MHTKWMFSAVEVCNKNKERKKYPVFSTTKYIFICLALDAAALCIFVGCALLWRIKMPELDLSHKSTPSCFHSSVNLKIKHSESSKELSSYCQIKEEQYYESDLISTAMHSLLLLHKISEYLIPFNQENRNLNRKSILNLNTHACCVVDAYCMPAVIISSLK